MKKIDVIQDNYRVLTATNEKDFVGRIVYTKWYTYNKAAITVGENVSYALESRGFWQTTQELLKDNIVVLNIKNKWSGNILISKPVDPERPYIFKSRGFFKNGFTLVNYKDEVLLEIVANFSWKKFNAGYTIACNDTFGNDDFEKALLMLSVHYLRSMQNQATGANA